MIWFSRILGGPQAFLATPPPSICSIYSINYWVANRAGGSSEQTSCGEEECSVTRGLKVRQSLPSRRCSWLFSAIVIYFGTQPEPAETHYPHCHVFRLTIWNTRRGHTYRTLQIPARSRQTGSTVSKGGMCFLPMSHTASNYQCRIIAFVLCVYWDAKQKCQ